MPKVGSYNCGRENWLVFHCSTKQNALISRDHSVGRWQPRELNRVQTGNTDKSKPETPSPWKCYIKTRWVLWGIWPGLIPTVSVTQYFLDHASEALLHIPGQSVGQNSFISQTLGSTLCLHSRVLQPGLTCQPLITTEAVYMTSADILLHI